MHILLNVCFSIFFCRGYDIFLFPRIRPRVSQKQVSLSTRLLHREFSCCFGCDHFQNTIRSSQMCGTGSMNELPFCSVIFNRSLTIERVNNLIALAVFSIINALKLCHTINCSVFCALLNNLLQSSQLSKQPG